MSGLINFAHTVADTSTSVNASFWTGYLIFIVAWYLLFGFILGKVFVKAGRPMWAAFVPFYNSWVMFELGGKSGANVFWILLPFIGGIVYIVQFILAMLEMGKRFGKSPVFSVFGLILFSIIGIIILAFDDSKYTEVGNEQSPAPVSATAAPATPAAAPADAAPASENNGQTPPPTAPTVQ